MFYWNSSVFQASGVSSLFESTEKDIGPIVAKDKIAEERKKPVESVQSLDDSAEVKKKPAGAVSLFGGIDILGDKQDTIKVSKVFRMNIEYMLNRCTNIFR